MQFWKSDTIFTFQPAFMLSPQHLPLQVIKMEMQKLTELLRATLDPSNRSAAEEQLKQLEKLNGFAPTLLQIMMNPGIDLAARVAGSIFLKNLVISSWLPPEADEPAPFQMQEQDRVYVRECLVDAVNHSPPAVRKQLLVCAQLIMKHDFPERWSLVIRLITDLQSMDAQVCSGGLSLLLELAKCFKAQKKSADRVALDDAMNLLLPFAHQIMQRILPDASQDGLVMQHLILKILFMLTEYHLPSHLSSKANGQWGSLQGWMQVVGLILTRRNPTMEQMPNDEISRADLEASSWWKTKKWAIRILNNLFEEKGIGRNYKEFLKHYIRTYSQAVIEEMLRILESFRSGHFVAGKVMREVLLYLDQASDYSHSWGFIKPHATQLLTHVILPLMCQCHSEEADQLWKDDPIEYNRSKYGEDITESVSCGEELLKTLCKKKEVLLSYIPIITQLLSDPNTVASPQRMDGALHIVGAVAEVLLKKNKLKEQLEDVLMGHVFTCMGGPYPFLRARAAWLVSRLSLLRFNRDHVLPKVVTGLVTAVLKKEEQLPVRIQSAFAIEDLVIDQHRSHQYFQPHVGSLCLELLEMLRNAEDDGLTSTLRKLFKAFPTEIGPLANDICLHIAHTFNLIIEGSGGTEGEKADLIEGLLHAMERISEVMQDHPELCLHHEPILQVTSVIFDNGLGNLYEKGFSLIESLTSKPKHITPEMWKMFESLYRVIERDGSDHFEEMMPALYNYVTVDTTGFLGDPNRVLALCTVIEKVMRDDSAEIGESAQCHAAKLIEVLILQCRQQIQNLIPGLLQLVLQRLTRPIDTCELRTMCLQVIMASLYNDVNQTVSVMSSQQLEAFIRQWISDAKKFSGIHDRKICVLGVCALLQSPSRLAPFLELSKQILPTLISLFEGLKRAYSAVESASLDSSDTEVASRSFSQVSVDLDDELNMSSDDNSSDKDDEKENTESEDDEVMNGEECEDDDEKDDEEDDYEDVSEEETDLDRYTTPLDGKKCSHDEYVVLKEVLLHLERTDPAWYSGLTSTLSEEQRKSMQGIFTEADKRKAVNPCLVQ